MKICIWTGPAYEPWSPLSLSTGLGGSETAAVYVAWHLVKMGHEVVVYNQLKTQEEVALKTPVFSSFIDSRCVTYRDYREVPLDQVSCDVFISSRQPGILSAPVDTKLRVLWVHDVNVGPDSPQLAEHLLRADVIFALSKWHLDTLHSSYPYVHRDTFVQTSNGVDPRRFVMKPGQSLHSKPGPPQVIYASSPDRGLRRLLDLWPAILKDVPDAQLHVYYGFETWIAIAEAQGAARSKFEAEQLLKRLGETPRVHYHGRVGQQELADAYMSSSVWAYPTWFPETYCISALEAQAAGCVCVTSRHAALPETVRYGVLLDMPESTQKYASAFVASVGAALRGELTGAPDVGGPDTAAIDLQAARSHALDVTWQSVAEQWSFLFEARLSERSRGPLLPLYGGL